MPKCDTVKQAKYDDFTTETWCRRCQKQYVLCDEGAAIAGCHKCGVFHLKEFMVEKIPGWFCRSCARDYDADLLKQYLKQRDKVLDTVSTLT